MYACVCVCTYVYMYYSLKYEENYSRRFLHIAKVQSGDQLKGGG